MQLDHLVVAGETLEAAVKHVQESLGVPMLPGGKHPRFGTHNALLGLGDGVYLEAIAIEPEATPESLPRWFGLDAFKGDPRLISWAVRVPDLTEALYEFPIAGSSIDMQRADLTWRMAVASDGRLPLGGAFPSILQWQASPIPGVSLQSSGCSLRRLTVQSPIEAAMFPEVSSKARIEYLISGEVRLEAHFDTPDGRRVLT